MKRATAFGLALYLPAFAFLLAPEWTCRQLADFKKIADMLPVAAPIVLGIAAYFVMGGVHNMLDRRFLGERRRVDDYIRHRIISPCREALCPRAIRHGIISEEAGGIMDLFYTFIPSDDTERERAFMYFTTYFIATNLSALSIGMSVAAILVAVAFPLPAVSQRIAFGIIALLAPGLATWLRLLSRRKLDRPAQAQTQRILAKEQDELKKLLPRYRIYEAGKLCGDSGKCPLIGRS